MSVADQARAYAATFVGGAVSAVSDISDAMVGLERLKTIELQAVTARNQLQELANAGAASKLDFAIYDTMRGSVWSAQMAYWNFLARVFAQLGLASQIPSLPVPRPMPAVKPGGAPVGTALAGVRGLAGPEVAPAAAAAALPPIVLYAAAFLAILVALAIIAAVVAVGIGVYELGAVYIAEVQVKQANDFYTARGRAYHDCLTAGGTPAACGADAIRLVPTPQDLLPKTPDPVGAIAWAVGGLAVVTIGILVVTKTGAKRV